MIKRKALIVILGLLISGLAIGQEAINKTDKNGLKQGLWVKKFENGNTLYEGTFVDNRPVGEFKRYYISGKLISNLYYHESGDSVDAVFYHPNEFLAARGKYYKQNKVGEWTFYSSKQEDCVICIENYVNNKKEGKSIKYHLNGNIAEELVYVNDLKHGPWKQYFTDGLLCIKSQYRNNRVHGSFETFHTNGEKEIIGTYLSDTREGEWKFYNDDGSFKRSIIYHRGVAENDKELIEEETRYLDMLEKNGGKIEDPEKSKIVW